MKRISYNDHKSLKALWQHIGQENTAGTLCVGIDTLNAKKFVKIIDTTKVTKRLLAATYYEIKGVGAFIDVCKDIVMFLKKILPPQKWWINAISSERWIRYNISDDLYIIHLILAHINYYILINSEDIDFLRNKLFNYDNKKINNDENHKLHT